VTTADDGALARTGSFTLTASATVAEFDDVAGWTADAVEQLGERYALPAAPAWSAGGCELTAGSRLEGGFPHDRRGTGGNA
jgi:hypothetical protein